MVRELCIQPNHHGLDQLKGTGHLDPLPGQAVLHDPPGETGHFDPPYALAKHHGALILNPPGEACQAGDDWNRRLKACMAPCEGMEHGATSVIDNCWLLMQSFFLGEQARFCRCQEKPNINHFKATLKDYLIVLKICITISNFCNQFNDQWGNILLDLLAVQHVA